MFRLLIVFVASSLLVGCGGPTAPSSHDITVHDSEMTWIDPSGTKMLVQNGLHSMHVVSIALRASLVWPKTMFRGDIESADQLVAAYRAGNLIHVTVTGTAEFPTNEADFAATIVTAVSQPTTTRHVAKIRVSCGSLVPSRVIDLYQTFIITPWTTLDRAGDITTYEAFLAASAAHEHVYLEGDGWIVGLNATHMRTATITWK